MVSRFVWHLSLDLSGLGDPASSYATAGIALGIIGARKPLPHVKVETPDGGILSNVNCLVSRVNLCASKISVLFAKFNRVFSFAF